MASPNATPRQVPEEVLRLVRASILGKHRLRVIYDGRERVLCPQMLGRNKDGQLRVLCLQVGGDSKSGLRGQGDWRCLALEKFRSAELVAGLWEAGHEVLRRPKCIEEVELEAAP